jgi:hypothetical protein
MAVVVTDRSAMLHLEAARAAAVTFAADVALVPAEAVTRLARIASIVVVTTDGEAAEHQAQRQCRKQPVHGGATMSAGTDTTNGKSLNYAGAF